MAHCQWIKSHLECELTENILYVYSRSSKIATPIKATFYQCHSYSNSLNRHNRQLSRNKSNGRWDGPFLISFLSFFVIWFRFVLIFLIHLIIFIYTNIHTFLYIYKFTFLLILTNSFFDRSNIITQIRSHHSQYIHTHNSFTFLHQLNFSTYNHFHIHLFTHNHTHQHNCTNQYHSSFHFYK